MNLKEATKVGYVVDELRKIASKANKLANNLGLLSLTFQPKKQIFRKKGDKKNESS